jgi:putative thioredoxin
VDVRDFRTEVIEASRERPVVVDFWAPWCGPCRILGPVLEKLSAENEGRWTLAKLNTDENAAIASRYGISGIPAVKMFVDGEVVGEFVGALPEARVRQWLDEHIPSPTKARVQAALQAFESGDAGLAERLVQDVLDVEPENPDASILLARLLAFREPERAAVLARNAAAAKPALISTGQAVDTVARLLAGAEPPRDGQAAQVFGSALERLVAGEVDAALAGSIEAIRMNRNYDTARRACLALFAVLGEKHPLTQKHRRAFDMAVF